MNETYNIGQLVRKLNINKETIRYYEKIGLLSQPVKDKNGYRIYSKEDEEKIRLIILIKKFGFSLKEIELLIHDEILCGDVKSIEKIVESKLNEVDNQINELLKTKKLLQKVNENILSKDIKCCNDIEIY